MKETRPYVSWELMNSFMIDAFKAYGVPEEDAKICADVLLESDRRGIESHGCNRFKPIYIDRIVKGTLLPVTNFEILKETPTTVVADAHDGMGMVAAHKVMTMLLEKAKKYGMAGGAIKNSTHYGIAGYWATMASREGMIGITGTNARPSTAPTFGVENMMGTNPLTFALPTDEDFPFCIDCATSIVQRGKIEYYAREGKPTPAGMVIARDGSVLTDSEQILEDLVNKTAALAPLGGIEVVSGLVKQKEIWSLQEGAGQGYTALFAAGEVSDGAVAGGSADGLHKHFSLAVQFPAAFGVDEVQQFALTGDEFVHLVLIAYHAQLFGDFFILLEQGHGFGGSGLDVFQHVQLRVELGLLGHIAHGNSFGRSGLALELGIDTGHNLEQTALAGSVGS